MDQKRKTISGLQIVGGVLSALGTTYLLVWGILLYARLFPFMSLPGLLILGLSFGIFLAGILCFAAFFKKKRKNARLKAEGEYLWATVDKVFMNTGISMGNRHPEVILAHYTDWNGTVHSCRSENLLFPPELVIENNQIGVYVDRNNPSKYWVDIEGKEELNM